MKRINLLFSTALLFVSTIAVGANVKMDDSTIDLSKASGVNHLTLDNFSGKPQKSGILRSYSVTLPKFDKMLYFGSDGAPLSGVVPSNRSMMWVMDNNFDVINKPSGKKSPGGYGLAASQSGTYSVVKMANGKYLAILPLVGEESMSYFVYAEGEAPLLNITTFGVGAVKSDLPVLAYAVSDNIYEASNTVWKYVVDNKIGATTAKMREDKEYPEYYKYLGWCSWEEYRDEINEKLLTTGMENIYKSNIPIRWVLVDEGPQWYINCDRTKRMAQGLLYSFDPDPRKFPNGLSPLMKYRREDGIKWFGIWHHEAGFFGRIDPNNIMGEELNKLFYNQKGYRTKPDYNSQYKFFEALFGYTIKDGFDFVKVDFQGPQFMGYQGSKNAVEAHVNTQRALENVCRDNNLGLINCFALDMVCALSSNHSAVTRASQDYRQEKPSAARVQTYQCYNNKLWMGQVVYGDHDMFHSNEPGRNRMMAVAKAMSAAPIYVSDAPENMNKSVIAPLCYNDGELLRPLAPALPLERSLFASPINTKNLYSVIAPLDNGAASIVSYNIYESADDVAISGSITADDYKSASAMMQPYPGEWSIPAGGLFLYDYYNKSGEVLNGEYSFTLTGIEDRFMHLCPIESGWAVVGDITKYLSPSAVKDIRYTANELSFQPHEAGEFVFYLAKGKPSCKGSKCISMGNGLWRIDVDEKMAASRIVITK